MGEDFPGQKRQQDVMAYSMASSFVAALVSGCVYQSVKTGWYTYLVGLFFTWLINVVEWSYFFAPQTSWSEGRYLDVAGYNDLEARDRMAFNQANGTMPKLRRGQITLFGGPASRMTISSKAPLSDLRVKKC
ncbi:hypothetical protein M758_4G262600 [Ceratodon purpureus]|nr:hypothetical protein M758_4G262600 [Ceratodon purpureus]